MNRRTLLQSVVAAGASGLAAEDVGASVRPSEQVRSGTVEREFRAVPFREGAEQPWNGQSPNPQFDTSSGERTGSETWQAWAKRLPERNLDLHNQQGEATVAPRTFNTHGWRTREDDATADWFGSWQAIADDTRSFQLSMGPMAKKDQFEGLGSPTYTTELNFDFEATVRVTGTCEKQTVQCDDGGGGSVTTPGDVSIPAGESPTIRFEGDITVTLTNDTAYEVFYEASDASYTIDAGGAEYATSGDSASVVMTPASVTEHAPTDEWDPGTVRIQGEAGNLGLDGGADLVVETSETTYTISDVDMGIDDGSLDGAPVEMPIRSYGSVTTSGDGGGGSSDTIDLFTTTLAGFLPDFREYTVFRQTKATNACSKNSESSTQELPTPGYNMFTLGVNGQPVGTWLADQLYFVKSPEPPYPEKVPASAVKDEIEDTLNGVGSCSRPLDELASYLDQFVKVVFEIAPPDNPGFSWLQAETPPSALSDGQNDMQVIGYQDLPRPRLRLHDVFVELAAPPVVGLHGWTWKFHSQPKPEPETIMNFKPNVEAVLANNLGQYPWVWAGHDLQMGNWRQEDDYGAAHPFVFFSYDRHQDVRRSAGQLAEVGIQSGVLGRYNGPVWGYAQSMGGLVFRTYLKEHAGTDRVEKLAMTGTPNLGTSAADAYVYIEDWYEEKESDTYYTNDGRDLEETEGIYKYRAEGDPWWETGVVDESNRRDHLADFQIKPLPHNGFLQSIDAPSLAMDATSYFTVIGTISQISEENREVRHDLLSQVSKKSEMLGREHLDDGVVSADSLAAGSPFLKTKQKRVPASHTQVPDHWDTAKYIGRFFADLNVDTGRPEGHQDDGGGQDASGSLPAGGALPAADAVGAALGSVGRRLSGGSVGRRLGGRSVGRRLRRGPTAALSRLAADPMVDAAVGGAGSESGRASADGHPPQAAAWSEGDRDAGVEQSFDPDVGVAFDVGDRDSMSFVAFGNDGEDRYRVSFRAPDGTVMDVDTDRERVTAGRTTVYGGTATLLAVESPAAGTWTVGLSLRDDVELGDEPGIPLIVAAPAAALRSNPVKVRVPDGVVERVSTPTPSAAATGTAGPTGTTGATASNGNASDATGTATPGFGAAVAAAGVVGAAAVRALRRRLDEE